MFAIKAYGTAVGIMLDFLSFIPCIGLIVLLIVNGKATTNIFDFTCGMHPMLRNLEK